MDITIEIKQLLESDCYDFKSDLLQTSSMKVGKYKKETKLVDSISYHQSIIVKMTFDNVHKSTWLGVAIQLIVVTILSCSLGICQGE